MTTLSIDECKECGVTFGGELMPNGEFRFRLNASDGSAYIRTVAASDSGWQNAHHHAGSLETYIVQSGWMAFATQHGNERAVRFYFPGQSVSSRPGEDHNVFLSAGAVIHTVKHGVAVGNPDKNGADWYDAEPTFNSWTRSLTVAELHTMARQDYSVILP